MSTVAIIGAGCKLSYQNEDTSWTAVSQLRTINRSGSKTAIAKITNMDSPTVVEGGLVYEEKLPTIIDPGEVALTGVLNANALANTLQSFQDAGTLVSWKITLPLDNQGGFQGDYTFDAYVTELAFDFDYTKEGVFSGKIDITGPVTYNAIGS